MSSLSLSIIVKNEEKYLEGCLESVKDVVDEIVIVDTGSSDKTLEIAKKYSSKIFHFKWCNDFSEARNYALSKSSGDWIFYLDADERLEHKSKNELLELIKSEKKLGINCYVHSISSDGSNNQSMKYIRLFKNDSKIKFSGKAHEQIEPSLRINNYEIVDSDLEIVHLGYDVSESELQRKAKRNLTLLMIDYKNKKSPYTAYQIANSYAALKKEKEKINYYSEALNDNSLDKELRSNCLVELADYELREGKLVKAKEYVKKGINENKDHILLKMIASQVYGKSKEFNKAIAFCEDALSLNRNWEGKNKNFKVQLVHFPTEKILYQGMLLSLISGKRNKFTIFCNNLVLIKKVEGAIITKLYENKNLSSNEIEQLVRLTSKSNLELISNLISNYEYTNKFKYLELAYEKFYNNSNFISFYVKNLISFDKNDEAQEVLESAINNLIFELPIIMYLTSIYLKTNQLDRLVNLLERLESESESNYELAESLTPLKNKLMPILQKVSS